MDFTTYKNGTTEGFCIVKTVEKKVNVKGVPYCDFTLSDKSGDINAKLWDYKEDVHGEYDTGDFVKVRGTLSKFNGTDQFRIDRLQCAYTRILNDVEKFIKLPLFQHRFFAHVCASSCNLIFLLKIV